MNWLFGLTFVVAFTYTVGDLFRRINAALDRRENERRGYRHAHPVQRPPAADPRLRDRW